MPISQMSEIEAQTKANYRARSFATTKGLGQDSVFLLQISGPSSTRTGHVPVCPTARF